MISHHFSKITIFINIYIFINRIYKWTHIRPVSFYTWFFIRHYNNLDILTNCSDGQFHSWINKSGDLICSLCSKSYNQLVKQIETSSSEKSNFEYLDKIKFINNKKLAKKYCLNGDFHEIGTNNICSKCNKNVEEWQPTEKELKQLEKNLEVKITEKTINQINVIRKFNENIQKDNENSKKIIISYFSSQ